MTSKSKVNATSKCMPNVKYHSVGKDEHEIFMDELYNKDKSIINPNEKAFDFSSISNYNSIFKYKSNQNYDTVNEIKPLNGMEKLINYTIIAMFYLMLVILFPFSLLVCLKKVKHNERIVVYRLGRIISPEYKPGYCILFPLVDSYQRFSIVQKEFCLPNLQILTHENAIVDTSTQVRYQINDVIKIANTIQDLNNVVKSVARGILVNILSKKDTNKIEVEKSYFKQDIKNAINESVNKWGIEITEVELTINSITKDENSENQEDPALKSIATVFRSLFNGNSTTASAPGTSSSKSDEANPVNATTDFLKFLTPFITPDNQNSLNIPTSTNNSTDASTSDDMTPFKLLKLLQPLINENVVKEIQTVYEFHIRITKNVDNYAPEKVEVYFLDLKNMPKGQIGIGNSLFSKADCIIKTSDTDLTEILSDKLKPFTAYMSGRIEIEGDLQDVFKLKKLIKSVTSILPIKK